MGSDAAGGDGDDVPPPPVERAPEGSVLRASTPWGVLHRSTEHRAVGGNRMARGTGDGGPIIAFKEIDFQLLVYVTQIRQP